MNKNKVVLFLSLITSLVYQISCFQEQTPISSGKLLDFGLKQPNQPNCNAIYFISDINDCKALKQNINQDSITIEITGGCFDSVDFSCPEPRLRFMYDNRFSITTRTCYLDTVSQHKLDSLSEIWKKRMKIRITYMNKHWLISSNEN